MKKKALKSMTETELRKEASACKRRLKTVEKCLHNKQATRLVKKGNLLKEWFVDEDDNLVFIQEVLKNGRCRAFCISELNKGVAVICHVNGRLELIEKPTLTIGAGEGIYGLEEIQSFKRESKLTALIKCGVDPEKLMNFVDKEGEGAYSYLRGNWYTVIGTIDHNMDALWG